MKTFVMLEPAITPTYSHVAQDGDDFGELAGAET